MFDEFQRIIDSIKAMPDSDKGALQAAFIGWCIAKCIYYIVCAFVVWALGRRLIQSSFAALREARRAAASE